MTSLPGLRLHRWLALALALALVLLPTAALADSYPGKPGMPEPPSQEELAARARVTQEQAVRMAMDAFAFPADWPEPTANLQPMGPDGAVWYLSWQDSNLGRMLASVTLNAVTGQIMWMNREDPRLYSGESVSLAVGREKARAIAEALLQKLNPEELAQTRLMLLPKPMGSSQPERVHWFNYQRVVNDIPFAEHNLSVNVSAIDGTIVNYGRNWFDDVTFQPADQLLTRDQALERMRAQPRTHLVYHRIGEGDEARYILVYMFGSAVRVNAITGDVLEAPYPNFLTGGEAVEAAGVEPRPRAAVTSADEAATLAREVLGLPESVKPAYVNQWPGDPWRPQGTWNVEFMLPGERKDQPNHANVAIEATTGRILNMYRSAQVDWETAKPTIGEAEAEALALALVRRHFGPELPNVRMITQPNKFFPPDAPEPKIINYMFQFNRVESGIPVENEGINVNVSAVTGQVENLWVNWGTVPLPPMMAAIPAEAADRIWWNRHQVELVYTTQLAFDEPYRPESGPRTAMPVWQVLGDPARPIQTPYLLASTGRFVDWQGAEVFDPAEPLADVVNHPAREALEFMAERRALEPRGGKLRPDDALTRLEAVLLLVRGMQPQGGHWKEYYPGTGYADVKPGHPYYHDILQAVAVGILPMPQADEAFGADRPVTRSEFVRMLGRALGLGVLEQMQGRLPVRFSDAGRLSAATQNVLAVLGGLGVVPDSTGEFRGEYPISRADAAVMVRATHNLKK